jgi:arginine transport system substrate-binding protein
VRFLIPLLALFAFTVHAAPIVVGTMAFNPPFETAADKNGNFFGFDIDIMNEICKRMQAECIYKPLNFARIFTDLLAGQVDLGLGSISITDTRKETFLFSLPYMSSSGQFIARADSTLASIDDLTDKTIGSVEGSLFKALALAKFHDRIKITEYRTLTEVFQALANSNVDAVIADEEAAKYWVATNSSMFKLLGEGMLISVGYGIMANKNSTDLMNRVNQALLSMETDGTYLKIYNRYFTEMGR